MTDSDEVFQSALNTEIGFLPHVSGPNGEKIFQVNVVQMRKILFSVKIVTFGDGEEENQFLNLWTFHQRSKCCLQLGQL